MDPLPHGMDQPVHTSSTQHGDGVHPSTVQSRAGSPPPPPPPNKIVLGAHLADTARFPFTLYFKSTTDARYDHQEHGKAYWSKDLGTPQAAIAIALQPWCDEKDCSLDMDWISVGLKGPTFTCSVPDALEPIVLHVIGKQGITIIKNGLQYKFDFEAHMDKSMDFDRDIRDSTLWAFAFFKAHVRASTAERHSFIETELQKIGLGTRLIEKRETMKHQVYFEYDADTCKHAQLATLKRLGMEGANDVNIWFNPAWFEPNLGGRHCTACYTELPRSNICTKGCAEKKISMSGVNHSYKRERKAHEEAAKRRKMEQQRAAGAGSSSGAIVPH